MKITITDHAKERYALRVIPEMVMESYIISVKLARELGITYLSRQQIKERKLFYSYNPGHNICFILKQIGEGIKVITVIVPEGIIKERLQQECKGQKVKDLFLSRTLS